MQEQTRYHRVDSISIQRFVEELSGDESTLQVFLQPMKTATTVDGKEDITQPFVLIIASKRLV